jgi:DNA-binding GntR family transcriptional regulator
MRQGAFPRFGRENILYTYLMTQAPLTRLDHVAQGLESEILEGRLVEGSALRQDAIARQYGVSHIPVREALRKLEARGLVRIEPHHGARVVGFSVGEILETLDVRVLLECAALEAAIPNLAREHFDNAEAVADLIDEQGDRKQWPTLNWRFHESLYSAAGRPVLLALIKQLHADPRSIRITSLITQDVKASNREHRKLIDLLRNDRNVEALALLRSHILIDPRKLRRNKSARRHQ